MGGFGCEDNPSYMIDVCAKSCNTCHLRDLRVRCAEVIDEPEALQPGDVNATFQRLLTIPSLAVEVLSRDPWIVRFPNFLDDEEVAFLLNAEAFGSWQDASDSGALDSFGRAKKIFSSHRSTGVIWCNHACHEHPVAKRVRARISEIVRVHPHYFESFQFLRYKRGQYYKPHHDAAGLTRASLDAAKHRVYTFFLYLNDVTDGGATNFPQLNLSVQPARGAAILWPSVRNEDPWQVDMRTEHQAEIVRRGAKYSMNIWIHQGPYTLAHDIACSGSPIG